MKISKVRFVWVRHGHPESLAEVKKILTDYNPEVVGLEMDNKGLKKLLYYNKRFNSEIFLAYDYALENKKKCILMDTEKAQIISKLNSKMGLLFLCKIVFRFFLSNLIRLFRLERPKKLRIGESELVKRYIVHKRDEAFSRKILQVINENPGQRILFIFGRDHREGILAKIKKKQLLQNIT